MKKLLLILAVLSVGAMFLPVSAQERGTRVRVAVDVPPPVVGAPVAAAPVYAPAYAAPAYAAPAYAPPLYAGAGCRGYSAGGCTGQQGGCQGRQGGYMLVPVAAGCQGRAGGSCHGFAAGAGCHGGAAFAAGYAVPAYGAPAYATPAPVGRGAPALYAGPREVYAAGNVRYGDSLSNGTYATPTGLPPGPGVLGVPGAGFPFDGPIRRTLRNAAGYDPGPASGTVRAGWVP
jgi:hypothetical protein